MDHAVASMGVEERCCGRSTTCPGLVSRWGGLVARLDRRTAISGVVDMVTPCRAVGELWRVLGCGGGALRRRRWQFQGWFDPHEKFQPLESRGEACEGRGESCRSAIEEDVLTWCLHGELNDRGS